jgi:quercetin dioxygenase-like cupin family protein
MKNKEYTDAVENGDYPENPTVSLDAPFKDERGIIQNIINAKLNGVAIITSKAGTIRSNHYHKNDFHYLYVISGKLEYYERDLNEDGSKMVPKLYTTGSLFFTPPNKVHKTVFIEDTVLLSMSKRNRDHNSHEEDLIREEF